METNYDNRYRENLPNIVELTKSKFRSIFRTKTLTDKFPICEWLPKYKKHYLMQDFIAGITVGLTSIPQAIAYGTVAGLQPQYGLYSAFMGCFTYVLFGSCKDVIIATTAPMALLIHDYAVLSPDFVSLISFLVGCIILFLGLFNLGVLVRFISIPVITGFTMAAATTIASAQINNLVGMKGPSNRFLPAWEFLFTNFKNMRRADAALGVSSLVFLLIMSKAKHIKYGSKVFWKYFSLARNALVVIIGMLIAYLLSHDGYEPFRLTGNITSGLPPFKFPPFSTNINGTEIKTPEMLNVVKSVLVSIPLVAILEIMAITKAFSKGKVVDASQELIALGMCNFMGSFVNSMPGTGSFTRTAVNNASGVRTPLGGAFTGSLVLLALAFLTQTFYFIPKTTLAAIIISAMISLIEYDSIAHMWKSKKLDLLPFLVTYLVALFWDLEYGILCGIALNAIFILFANARPDLIIMQEKVLGCDVCIVHVRQGLFYAGAEYLREKVLKHNILGEPSNNKLVIIKGDEINFIDFTVASNIISLRNDLFLLNKISLICWNWNINTAGVLYRLNQNMAEIFKDGKSLEEIVQEYLYAKSIADAITVAVNN